jgi:hypothetical protein
MTAIGIAFIKSIVNLYLQVSMKNEKYNEVGKMLNSMINQPDKFCF